MYSFLKIINVTEANKKILVGVPTKNPIEEWVMEVSSKEELEEFIIAARLSIVERIKEYNRYEDYEILKNMEDPFGFALLLTEKECASAKGIFANKDFLFDIPLSLIDEWDKVKDDEKTILVRKNLGVLHLSDIEIKEMLLRNEVIFPQ